MSKTQIATKRIYNALHSVANESLNILFGVADIIGVNLLWLAGVHYLITVGSGLDVGMYWVYLLSHCLLWQRISNK